MRWICCSCCLVVAASTDRYRRQLLVSRCDRFTRRRKTWGSPSNCFFCHTLLLLLLWGEVPLPCRFAVPVLLVAPTPRYDSDDSSGADDGVGSCSCDDDDDDDVMIDRDEMDEDSDDDDDDDDDDDEDCTAALNAVTATARPVEDRDPQSVPGCVRIGDRKRTQQG